MPNEPLRKIAHLFHGAIYKIVNHSIMALLTVCIYVCVIIANISSAKTENAFVKTDSFPSEKGGMYSFLGEDKIPDDWEFKSAAKHSIRQISGIRGTLQNMFVSLMDNFQELVNRQQALLDLIYCKNCGTNPWQHFLSAMAHIPTLGWVMRPTHTQGPKPDGSFIAATNVNGVVNGVGGAIYNGDPVVEYTFNNNHVSPVRPRAYTTNNPLSTAFKT